MGRGFECNRLGERADTFSHQPKRVDINDYLGAGNFLGCGVGQHGAQKRVQFFAAGRLEDEMIAVVALKTEDWRGGGS